LKTGKLLTVIILSLCAVSCGQDSIFFRITTETPPLPALVGGAPTNAVVKYGTLPSVDIMYVASGQLHWYAKATGALLPEWNSNEFVIPQPGGKHGITALAVSNNLLYALCYNDNFLDKTLKYININATNPEWSTISYPGGMRLLSIYAAPESTRLFACASTGNTYTILYLDGTELKPLESNTSPLSGAAFDGTNHYLSTVGDGIWMVVGSATTASKLSGSEARMLMRMIQLGTTDPIIIAIERNNGYLYKVNTSSTPTLVPAPVDGAGHAATGYYATGALALWTIGTTPLLVAGIQSHITASSNNTYGYCEFQLKPDLTIETSANTNSLLSVGNQTQYDASLRKYPINHLFQAPSSIDPNKTLFAATQTKGLWSYKDRGDGAGPQWNAEN